MRHVVLGWLLLIGLHLATAPTVPASMRGAPGAQQVLIWEQTGGITQLVLGLNDSRLLARLSGNLAPDNSDYVSGAAEYYDFFYSNADGSPNQGGEYLTIECAYVGCCGPGLNINEVALSYADGQQVFGCGVSTAVYGPGAVDGSALLAVDGNISTTSRMGGNTAGSDRLRITVDMRCAPTPTRASTWGQIKTTYR